MRVQRQARRVSVKVTTQEVTIQAANSLNLKAKDLKEVPMVPLWVECPSLKDSKHHITIHR